jgi:hypothetical protein
LWLGYGFKGGAAHFINKHYEDYATAGDHKEGMIRVSGVHWFTNLDISKRHEDLILYKNYNPEEYPTYENLDAINIDKTKDIPVDYDGYMGVPITFLDKYNPEQFEIIGQGRQDLCPGYSSSVCWLSDTYIAYIVVITNACFVLFYQHSFGLKPISYFHRKKILSIH